MLIDFVAELLKDGKWHRVSSIARELDQPEEKILKILKFCADFNFVILDKTGNQAKIDKRFRRLLDTIYISDFPMQKY